MGGVLYIYGILDIVGLGGGGLWSLVAQGQFLSLFLDSDDFPGFGGCLFLSIQGRHFDA